MFKSGDIVYHDELYFQNNILDKKINRPCVVLYEIMIDGTNYVCTCPLTSQVRTFNKRPQNYVLIPTVIYNYKKISFANLLGVGLRKEENTHNTNIPLDKLTVTLIKEKIMKSNLSELEEIKKQLIEIKNEEKSVEKKEKNLLKKMKKENRRKAKRAN